MCGVVGLIQELNCENLGKTASKLLRMLEYRGYDSTGAVIQDSSGPADFSRERIILRKDVGSPTDVTKRLKINELGGRIFCGQVRWATFGTVTQKNAQPHVVECKTLIYGAHNGNITNCEQLKKWLISEGHDVKSDNDGEMLVHSVEHFFAIALNETADKSGVSIENINPVRRKELFKNAVVRASKEMVGSFAALIVDPVTQVMCCIKAGSSLYIGKGFSDDRGSFMVVSSDLGSVLSQTKILLPISEGEFAILTDDSFKFYNLSSGEELLRTPVRSRLKVEETRLHEPYKYFMEQEIAAQESASRKLIDLFMGTSLILEPMRIIQGLKPDLVKNIKRAVDNLAEITDLSELKARLQILKKSEDLEELRQAALKQGLKGLERQRLESSLATFLEEIKQFFPSRTFDFEAKLIDAIFLLDEVWDIEKRINNFVDRMVRAYEYGSCVYLVACGTSYHAAKTASLFFNRIPGLNIYPLLPGEFRAQYSGSIRDRDVIIGISQSGETKDLIDIFNLAQESGRDVTLISVVNNVNSTLALEKSELYIPLFCGPEISVPATKSFMNQLLVLYILALRLGKRFSELGIKKVEPAVLDEHTEWLFQIPELISNTIQNCNSEVTRIAKELYMEPSMHILATGMLGIAKEGALKIREVVLNHTEGFEGAEFKHGPNTILGVNTIFGMQALKSMIQEFSRAVNSMLKSEKASGLSAEQGFKILKAVAENTFADKNHNMLSSNEKELFEKVVAENDFFDSLYTNYPLIFVTNPAEKDVNLTISQINTHKIRGANVYIIAEENSSLRDAIDLVPDTKFKNRYRKGYIVLPKTGNEMMTVFTSTVALQCLAFNMSTIKMEKLNKLGITEHGVHPDSPKNVSKSITVD